MKPAWPWLVWLAMLAPLSLGEVHHISITLQPRNYTHPRDLPGFTCGLQDLDSSRLLAELSSPYILQQVDNTGDPDSSYRTSVHDMAFLTSTNTIHLLNSPCTTACTALYSLVLLPPTGTCHPGMFSDAETLGKNHVVVYIGTSLPESIIAKIQSQADKLKGLFGGEMPRMCATQTKMEPIVAESRVQTLTALFNFPFLGAERQLADMERRCTTSVETEQSIAFSGVFDYIPESVNFVSKNGTVYEETGFCRTNISRSASGKIGVAFVETTLGAATKSDLIPLNGPVAFKLAETTASILIREV